MGTDDGYLKSIRAGRRTERCARSQLVSRGGGYRTGDIGADPNGWVNRDESEL
jgi:hypothetical protein